MAGMVLLAFCIGLWRVSVTESALVSMSPKPALPVPSARMVTMDSGLSSAHDPGSLSAPGSLVEQNEDAITQAIAALPHVEFDVEVIGLGERPVADAQVRVAPAGELSLPASGTTDVRGRVRVSVARLARRFQITATKDGAKAEVRFEPPPFRVRLLLGSAPLRVRVRDQLGRPIEGAAVHVYSIEAPPDSGAVTDASGEAVVDAPLGRQRIDVSVAGSVSLAMDATVEPTGENQLDVELEPAGTIEVSCLCGETPCAARLDGIRLGSVQNCNEQGRGRLEGVPGGRVRIQGKASPNSEMEAEGSSEVLVEPGREQHVSIRLARTERYTSALEVSVRDPHGVPVAGAETFISCGGVDPVASVWLGRELPEAMTDSEGRVRFGGLPRVECALTVRRPGRHRDRVTRTVTPPGEVEVVLPP